jgi:hypothetical protein
LGWVLVVAAPSVASARSFRVSEIPNGEDRTCRNCHGDLNGSTMTDFGSAARGSLDKTGPIQEAHVHWDVICDYDSDGDGWTNGEELGDPDCVWTIGATPAKSTSFNPGDKASHPPPVCNNGKLDAGEPCEGTTMSTTDCMDESAGNGVLSCTDTCDFDYSACSAPPGNVSSDGDGSETLDEGCRVGSGSGARGSGAGGAAVVAALALAVAGSRRRRR